MQIHQPRSSMTDEATIQRNPQASLQIIKPTVSPLIILLLYCHINGFQRASSAEKPLPGGEKRMDGWAAHPVAWCGDGVVSFPVCSIVVSLIARGCLIGATG